MTTPKTNEYILREIEHLINVSKYSKAINLVLEALTQKDTEIQKAREEERERISKSVNDKQKQEQILATLLLKIAKEGEEIIIHDNEIICNDWVVFEKRDVENSSTIYKILRNSPTQTSNR